YRVTSSGMTSSTVDLSCNVLNNAAYAEYVNFQSFTATATSASANACSNAVRGYSATSGSFIINDFTLSSTNSWVSWGSSTAWNIKSVYTNSGTSSTNWSAGTGTVTFSGFNTTGKTITFGSVGNEFHNLTFDSTASTGSA